VPSGREAPLPDLLLLNGKYRIYMDLYGFIWIYMVYNVIYIYIFIYGGFTKMEVLHN